MSAIELYGNLRKMDDGFLGARPRIEFWTEFRTPSIPFRSIHDSAALLLQRIYQIVAHCEDANDANRLRHDPMLQIVADQTLGDALGSQPTLSRWENAPSVRDLVRLSDTLREQFIRLCGGSIQEMGGLMLMISVMLFLASRDAERNVTIIDALIAGLCILAITPLISLYTLDVGRLYAVHLIWGRSFVGLVLAGVLFYLRPRKTGWRPVGIVEERTRTAGKRRGLASHPWPSAGLRQRKR